jgi:hypothetical protein
MFNNHTFEIHDLKGNIDDMMMGDAPIESVSDETTVVSEEPMMGNGSTDTDDEDEEKMMGDAAWTEEDDDFFEDEEDDFFDEKKDEKSKNKSKIDPFFDDYDEDDNDGFLNEQTSSTGSVVNTEANKTLKINNKLRKYDTVKIISTPNGRVGIVYQAAKPNTNSNNNNNNFDDFGGASSSHDFNFEDPQQHQPKTMILNRNANDVKLIPDNNSKITPVLTADGKVALLYRGESSKYFDSNNNNDSNSNGASFKKYEPITNLTSIMTATNNDNNNSNVKDDSINLDSSKKENSYINKLDDIIASVTNRVKHLEEEIVGHFDESEDSTTESLAQGDLGKQESSLLINRPLSEVLGIKKKTHYHHPHHSTTEENSFSSTGSTTTTTTPSTPVRTSINTDRTKVNEIYKTNIKINKNQQFEPVPTMDTNRIDEDFENHNIVNIAVIPAFHPGHEDHMLGQPGDYASSSGTRNETYSFVHCTMQFTLVVACMCAIFGLIGTYYKVHIINNVRVMYW